MFNGLGFTKENTNITKKGILQLYKAFPYINNNSYLTYS